MPSSQRRKIKAILFDMDGTLLDTESLSDKAVLLAFGPPSTSTSCSSSSSSLDSSPSSLPHDILQHPPISELRLPWDLKRQILGLRGSEWAPLVLAYAEKHWGVSLDDDFVPDPMQLWQNWERRLNDLCRDVEACPGAVELIDAIVKTTTRKLDDGNDKQCILMAIATSSRSAGVEKKRLRHNDTIFSYMDAIVCGDDPSVKNGKPAPDIYEEAARRLNVDPDQCLVFEDALSGVRSAKAAGCTVIAIPDTRFSTEEKAVFEQEADVVLSTLWEFDGRPFGINVDMSAIAASREKKKLT